MMKKLLALFTTVILLCSTCYAAEEGWLTDYNEALAQAKKENKNMMVLFTGSDWCIWCKRLQADVLTKDEFKNFAKENLILLALDFPRENKPSAEVQAERRALAEKYDIEGYPTLVLLTPEEKDFGRLHYTKEVSDFLAEYKKLAQAVKTTKEAVKEALQFDYTIRIRYKDFPEMEGWMKSMQAICKEWYPILAAELNSEGFKPASTVTITLQSDPKGVAGTGGDHIYLSNEYFSKNGTDAGAVIHELAHVIQAYPTYVPWITESIADYMRLYKFEPNAPRPTVDPERFNLQRGYKGGAAFLAWLVEKKNPEIVVKLNAALRADKYKDELFEELAGSSLEDLVKEFKDSLK